MRKASTLGRGKPTTKSGIHAIRTLQCAYVSSLYSGLALQCILQTRVDRDTLACQHTAVSYEPPKATFFQGDFGSLALDVLDVLSHPQEIATDDTNLLIIFVISFWRITIVGNFQIPQTESDTHRKEKNSCIWNWKIEIWFFFVARFSSDSVMFVHLRVYQWTPAPNEKVHCNFWLDILQEYLFVFLGDRPPNFQFLDGIPSLGKNFGIGVWSH